MERDWKEGIKELKEEMKEIRCLEELVRIGRGIHVGERGGRDYRGRKEESMRNGEENVAVRRMNKEEEEGGMEGKNGRKEEIGRREVAEEKEEEDKERKGRLIREWERGEKRKEEKG